MGVVGEKGLSYGSAHTHMYTDLFAHTLVQKYLLSSENAQSKGYGWLIKSVVELIRPKLSLQK